MIVGLTGGIGSGKTQVSNILETLGIGIVDADIVAREVVAPGQPALASIAAHFGQDYVPKGQLDRAKLRQHIFAHPEHKQWLEALLHPLIRQQIENQLTSLQSPYKVLVAPLLLENQLNHLVDKIWVVDIPEHVQCQRTAQRDQLSPEQVTPIIASQLARQARLAAADEVIDNQGSREQLQQQVLCLHQAYLQKTKANDSV